MDSYEIESPAQPSGNGMTTVRSQPSGGIYDLPVIGSPARGVRNFYDDMRPLPDDSTGVVVGKELLRYGAVVAAGTVGVAVGMIVAL
jgi:hypothetical protein